MTGKIRELESQFLMLSRYVFSTQNYIESLQTMSNPMNKAK